MLLVSRDDLKSLDLLALRQLEHHLAPALADFTPRARDVGIPKFGAAEDHGAGRTFRLGGAELEAVRIGGQAGVHTEVVPGAEEVSDCDDASARRMTKKAG